jgi:hypothetical protein
MDAAEFNELKKKLKAEYEEKLRALEMVYGFAKTKSPRVSSAGRHVQQKQESVTSQDTETESSDIPASADIEARGAVLQATRNAVAAMGESQFTWRTLVKKMLELAPGRNYVEPSVRQAIGRLEELKEIEVATRGSGRNPSIYRRAAT